MQQISTGSCSVSEQHAACDATSLQLAVLKHNIGSCSTGNICCHWLLASPQVVSHPSREQAIVLRACANSPTVICQVDACA